MTKCTHAFTCAVCVALVAFAAPRALGCAAGNWGVESLLGFEPDGTHHWVLQGAVTRSDVGVLSAALTVARRDNAGRAVHELVVELPLQSPDEEPGTFIGYDALVRSARAHAPTALVDGKDLASAGYRLHGQLSHVGDLSEYAQACRPLEWRATVTDSKGRARTLGIVDVKHNHHFSPDVKERVWLSPNGAFAVVELAVDAALNWHPDQATSLVYLPLAPRCFAGKRACAVKGRFDGVKVQPCAQTLQLCEPSYGRYACALSSHSCEAHPPERGPTCGDPQQRRFERTLLEAYGHHRSLIDPQGACLRQPNPAACIKALFKCFDEDEAVAERCDASVLYDAGVLGRGDAARPWPTPPVGGWPWGSWGALRKRAGEDVEVSDSPP